MVDAIPSLIDDNTIRIFEKFGVLNSVELHSRAEVNYENYSKTLNIEAKTMIEMVNKQYIPAVIKAVKVLADSINSITTAVPGADVSVQIELLNQSSNLLAKAKAAVIHLEDVVATAETKAEGKERATYFKDVVTKAMDDLRAPIDALELIIDKSVWPVPTYGDLLFEV